MRKRALILVLFALVAVGSVIAIAAAPKGKYRGTERSPGYGSGSNHRVSFVVRRGKLRKLVIGKGQAYCYPPRVRGRGFAPGYFDAPSPRLRRFPTVRVRRRAGRYRVRVTYKRTGKRWRRTRSRKRLQGPGYFALRGTFRGRRFSRRGRITLRVRYGANAEGKPIWRRGKQQCIFEGKLSSRKRRRAR
jgi:hypothetical protein